jgi:hypothetical protein
MRFDGKSEFKLGFNRSFDFILSRQIGLDHRHDDLRPTAAVERRVSLRQVQSSQCRSNTILPG